MSLLKPHEKIRQGHLEKLMDQIKKDGCVKNPIIVDKNTMIILDGHHRFNSLKIMGIKLIPVCLIDYRDEAVTVGAWRKGEKVTKDEVVAAGLSGKLLNPKTSHHMIPNRPMGLKIPLADLK